MRSTRTVHPRSILRRTLVVAAAVALSVPLAACSSGGGGTASNPTGTPDPSASPDAAVPSACTILGTDQIKASTGIVTDAGVLDSKRSDANTSVCEWKPKNADSPSIEVLISFTKASASAAPTPTPTPTPAPAASPDPSTDANSGPIAAERAAAEAALGASTDVVVAGGNDAFILANGSVVGMNLKTVKHSYYIQVTYSTGDSTDASLITKALAALVATSL